QPVYSGGVWTVVYTVTVKHAAGSKVPTQYTLSDTPSAGSGITITSSSSGTETSTDSPFTLTLATAKSLAVGATDTYDVTVTYTTGANPDLTCATGGAKNTATVTWSGGTDNDTACAPIPSVSLTKTAPATASATATPGEFTTTYTVTVSNKSAATTYNLNDAFDFAGSIEVLGVDSVGFVAAPVAVVDNPTFTANTSGVTATAVPIAAGTSANPTTHTWTITVRVRLNGDESSDAVTCAANDTADRGLFNKATVTVQGYSADDTACSNLPKPAITVVKTPDSGVTATGPAGGPFTATYTVTVTNNGTAPGSYVLKDVPAAVSGTTITNIAITSASPAVNVPNYTSGTALPIQAIAASTAHVYTVTVTFTVATVTAANVVNFTCAEGTPVAGKGQVNTATITVAGTDSSDTG
ncbi:MAG TPA: hypothetical protein PLV68_06300, partial [Ilumatobacteraceae bacterium]|nr:hypothetical protein [Ilumatobacteraceae bacterium]